METECAVAGSGEKAAIDQLRRGDINGLEFLVRVHQVQAVRAAYLVVHDRQVAEDIVQSAFIKVFRRIQQFDRSRPFAPWFMRIVVNDAIKAATRRRREVSLEGSDYNTEAALAEILRSAEPGPEEVISRAETASAVEEALMKLPPKQRAAVVLRYYIGLKEPEIALRIGRSRGTVKWLLHNARKRLSRLLMSSEQAPVGPVGPTEPGKAEGDR
jgi:RNA polymerase sigma-70 factor (ECF subfamily)